MMTDLRDRKAILFPSVATVVLVVVLLCGQTSADQTASQTVDLGPGSAHPGTTGEVRVAATRNNSLVLAIGVSGVGADEFSLGGSVVESNIKSSTVDAHVWGGSLDGWQDKINAPAYMEKDGKTYRIISDHLGSPDNRRSSATGSD